MNTSPIVRYLIEHRFISIALKETVRLISKSISFVDFVLSIPFRFHLSKSSDVIPNKIVFMTYSNDYICNPKYICEEILRQNLPVDLVWATTTKKLHSTQFPDRVRPVIRGSYEFFQEIASAKIWIDNAVCFTWNPFPKKDEQFYIQTWHGSMGLKRIGKNDVRNRHWNFAAHLSQKYTDLCISNSTFETSVFRQTHWPNTPILELGHARNDILFADSDTKAEIVSRVHNFFGIPSDKKIVLYAPTFRNTSNSICPINSMQLLSAVESKFGGKWVLLNRFHFKTKQSSNRAEFQDCVYQANNYPDMQELMLAADLGITDYSSWICDYVLTKKPAFIFAPDLNQYNQERGFYYPLNTTPFAIANTNEELVHAIQSFDKDLYFEKCEQFLIDRGCKEYGHAAEQIVEIIKTHCNLT